MTPAVPDQTEAALAAAFPGESEMAQRARVFDWASTPLGPVQSWPACLTVTVRNLMVARSPMFLFWGPHLIQFYNDAYRPSLGASGRHPEALGASGPAFWSDIWDIIGPEIAGVMTTGEPTWHVDQFIPIERDGVRADVWWTYGYSAVYMDDGTIGGTLVVCQETTARVLAEREQVRLTASLLVERERLGAVFEQAPAFLAMLRGPEHTFALANPAYLQLVGRGDIVGKTVAEAIPEIRDQGFIDLLDRVRDSGEPFVGRHVPAQLARNAGVTPETRYLNFVYQRLTEADGTYAIIAHGVDVTDEVLSVQKLQHSEQELREQFQRLPIPTTLWEIAGDDIRLVEYNLAAAPLYESLGAEVGAMALALFPGMGAVVHECFRAARDNVSISMTVEQDFGRVGKRNLELTIGPKPPGRVLIHALDVTERVAMEDRLRQAERAAAVSRLSGILAHDFNNSLGIITAHSAFLLESLPPTDPMHADVQAIQTATHRAAELTRQLLAYSQKQLLTPIVADVADIVAEAGILLRRVLGATIELRIHRNDPLGPVLLDKAQAEQALVNLAINARDAMPGGGQLTFTTRQISIAAPSTLPLAPGTYVEIEVVDTGTGMTPEVQAQIFEPFFTTKEAGRGTGLGLPSVLGFVEQSSGHIEVNSAPGVGTAFRLYFPVVATERPREQPRTERESVGGQETLLVVDDEPALRAVAARSLRRYGYSVLEAANGQEALAISASTSQRIDLVLSDSEMPGMNGAEVVRRLLAERPGLRVLMMSGFTSDDVTRRGILDATISFILKPFTPRVLARAVRDVLDVPPAGTSHDG